MNVTKEIERITAKELEMGIYGGLNGSWHEKYKNSAWVFVGGLSFDLTEGDIICVMSQWGEVLKRLFIIHCILLYPLIDADAI